MLRIVKIIVSIALIYLAVYFLDIDAIKNVVKEGSVWHFTIAVIINLLAFLVMAVRWNILILPLVKLPYLNHIGFYFKGTFINTFTPSNLGSDAYRLTVLRKRAESSSSILKLLLRERIIGFYGYVVVFVIAYSYIFFFTELTIAIENNPYTYGCLVAIIALLLPIAVYSLEGVVRSFFRKHPVKQNLYKINWSVKALYSVLSLKDMMPLMFLSLIGTFLWVISIKVIADGFGLSVSLIDIAAVATMVEVVRIIPLTIQGIGLREGMFAYLMSLLGYDPEYSYAVGAIAYLALSVAIALSGPVGSVILWQKDDNNNN